MPEFYGANYAGLMATPVQRVNGGDYGGIVRAHYDAYTTTGVETAGSTIIVGFLEPGERFLGGVAYWEALGAGVTMMFGRAGNADLFLTATSASSAGTADLSNFGGIGTRNGGATGIPLFVTLGGATPVPGKGIKIEFRTVRK